MPGCLKLRDCVLAFSASLVFVVSRTHSKESSLGDKSGFHPIMLLIIQQEPPIWLESVPSAEQSFPRSSEARGNLSNSGSSQIWG